MDAINLFYLFPVIVISTMKHCLDYVRDNYTEKEGFMSFKDPEDA